MKKRIIAFILAAVMVFGIVPMALFAVAEDDPQYARGDYIYSVCADPLTNTVPAEFGTAAANGRIWTDKSVSLNGDRFNVDLSVLAQEYVSSKNGATTTSIAADVVMVLDVTTSMRQNLPKGSSTVQRAEAMSDSVNEAIEIITTTNPNNRISIYTFCGNAGSPTVNNVMPLAHYTSSSTATDTVGKYVTYGSNTLQSSSTLLKDGVPFNFSQGLSSGTGTQAGIANSIKGLVDNINAETDHSTERKPYVIVLTDGEATSASKNWYTEDMTQLTKNTVSSTGGGQAREIVSAATILTAALWKDRLEAAYDNYNGAGKNHGVEWFNIGLGIDDATDPYDATAPNCMLNPNYLRGITGSNNSTVSSAEKIVYYLGQPDYAPKYTEKDYLDDYGYVYVNSETGYVTFADTYAVLMNAFTTLANIIRMGSASYTIPIVYHEGLGGTESDVEFTDVIGAGMYITDLTLKPNGKPAVTGEDPDSDGVYTFSGYSTTARINEDSSGQQTLIWTIPATEVAMYTFADRTDLNNGMYIPADPTVLSVGIDYTDEIGMGPGFTNAFDSGGNPRTTVSYEIPGDNEYYFDVTTNSLHEFVSAEMKTGLDSTTAKSENKTSSCADSHRYAFTAVNDSSANASATVNGQLGNNGRVSFAAYNTDIDIEFIKKWQDKDGNEIAYSPSLPDITVSLYRTPDGSSVSEFVESKTLGYADNYTTTWNMPRKDSGGNIYTYTVAEDPPDGYYIYSNSGGVHGYNGTVTITNRMVPDSGLVTVKKLWQNKIGADISDTSAFPGVEVELWRKGTVTTPDKVTVTVNCESYNLGSFDVQYGTVIRFKLRAYIRTKTNAQSAVISLGDTALTSTYGSRTQGGNTYHYTQTDMLEYTITEDTALNYTVSKSLNSSQLSTPCELIDRSYTAATGGSTSNITPVYVSSATLSNSNNWKAYFDSLPESQVIEGKTYHYKYYVKEISGLTGFTPHYSANNTAGITGGTITVTNKSDSNIPILPDTGGQGIKGITAAGILILSGVTVAALVRSYTSVRKKKRRRTD